MTLWKVHKFGGTSVANADCYRQVARVLTNLCSEDTRILVVVSAMAKVTDSLLHLLDEARLRDEDMKASFSLLVLRHSDVIDELLEEGPRREDLHRALKRDAKDLEDVLRSCWLMRSASLTTREFVSGHGELWSARLLAAFLDQTSRGNETSDESKQACALDAREVLFVKGGDVPILNEEKSSAALQTFTRREQAAIVVATGYICTDEKGVPTTLKRNGSDLSAAVFGALLDAASITVWTDVDGILSADPRKVPDALVTPRLSYNEAIELAYFGAKVLHPGTMAPAISSNIPIYIKNTFRPDQPGSCIHDVKSFSSSLDEMKNDDVAKDALTENTEHNVAPSEKVVRGFATIEDLALFNVEGTGMMGVPGIAERVFGALREVDVSVVLISQASSEHSICFAIPNSQRTRASAALSRALLAELSLGQVQTIGVQAPCAILAAVGDGMVEQPGVSGRFFGALGNAGISVRAVAQGSSERNISAVVDEKDATRALRAVHAAFTLSDQTLSVGLIGPGLIGKTLLAQLEQQAELLKKEFHIDLRLRGILSSKKTLLDDEAIDLSTWKTMFDDVDTAGSFVEEMNAFINHVQAPHLPHAVLVDCTASEEIASHYPDWMARGLHVVTPNKKASAGPTSLVDAIAKSRKRHTHYFYEGTVGAGLPILQTLRSLLQTGDEVVRIEGVLSGTLSYLFNTFNEDTPFSSLVADARAKGFTEPDPRDDLSGMDVARKVLILARELGMCIDIDDINVQSLTPKSLKDEPDVEAFLKKLSSFDDDIEKKRREAAERNEVLRYVGSIDVEHGCKVELQSLKTSNAFAGLTGSDNIIAFTTRRYSEQPLIVRGPGAGPEVTAGGVFSDLLRLCAHLGAQS
ncbi:MAG: bifunctional aspartate kinase/homoserine dehydrogenase I [Deltaproteobacteria bacterium]|nr:bifunctional aspartate kinase/homoserine dehydrogenase I [Deltaproteobacteria bacterium]